MSSRLLVLASGSPRRRDLLGENGFRFRIDVPDTPELAAPGESPAALVQRIALEKARVVELRAPEGSCVLAADTIVVIDDEVLGKPRDERHAAEMLLRLAGRTHRVLTGFALLVVGDDTKESVGVETSAVTLRALSPEQARAYVASGEPLDKAGSYALQGEGGRFVEAVEGSRSNVIGLPLERVGPLLEAAGVRRG